MHKFGLNTNMPVIEFLACKDNDDDVYVVLRGATEPICIVLNEVVDGKTGRKEPCPTVLKPNIKTRLNSVHDRRKLNG